MKNEFRLSFKNTLFIIIPLFCIVLISSSSNAQSIDERIGFDNDAIANFDIKYFKVKEASNKLYFKFLLIDNRENTNYTLESSANGVDYYMIKSKEGFKSPNGIPLLYCYTVDLNSALNFTDIAYRVKIDSDEGVCYSSIIEIEPLSDENLSARIGN